MRYSVSTLIAAALAFVTSVVWVLWSIPGGEGSFGIVKLVPTLIIIWTIVFFSFLWLPANLVAFATTKTTKRTLTGIVIILVSAGAIVAGANWIVSMRRSKAENSRIVR